MGRLGFYTPWPDGSVGEIWGRIIRPKVGADYPARGNSALDSDYPGETPPPTACCVTAAFGHLQGGGLSGPVDRPDYPVGEEILPPIGKSGTKSDHDQRLVQCRTSINF